MDPSLLFQTVLELGTFGQRQNHCMVELGGVWMPTHSNNVVIFEKLRTSRQVGQELLNTCYSVQEMVQLVS